MWRRTVSQLNATHLKKESGMMRICLDSTQKCMSQNKRREPVVRYLVRPMLQVNFVAQGTFGRTNDLATRWISPAAKISRGAREVAHTGYMCFQYR